MSDHIDPQWREKLRRMPPEEQRAFLRAVMRLRVYCPRCPVKTPQLHREPCYSCAVLPGDLGLPKSTVN